jgi:hypothetical protein
MHFFVFSFVLMALGAEASDLSFQEGKKGSGVTIVPCPPLLPLDPRLIEYLSREKTKIQVFYPSEGITSISQFYQENSQLPQETPLQGLMFLTQVYEDKPTSPENKEGVLRRAMETCPN